MSTSKKGLQWAVIIHLVFFGCVGFLVLFQLFFKEKKPKVLTLVSPPSASAPVENASTIKSIQAPKIESRVSQPLPDVPEPVEAPPKPKVARETISKKAKPKPIAPPKKISAADFFKQHTRPKVRSASRPKPSQSVVAPKIDVNKVTDSLQKLSRAQSSVNTSELTDPRRLQNYLSRLQEQIEMQWHKPNEYSGETEWAEVEIALAKNGQILNFKILRQQGSSAFIQSIELAIQRAHSNGPTPIGERMSARFTFRLQQE